MSKSVAIQPPRVYPTFRYRDPAAMIDWLVKVFGFSIHARYGEGNTVVHAELALGSSIVMLGQVADDAYGAMVGGPGENGGKSTYVAVEDVDLVHERAVKEGAEILQGPVDRDYGSREFICRDPEGNIWSVGTYWPKAHEAAEE
ncbi:VOC family protein [Chelativorans sp. AA-79]|uniref:VOC family protein n=1 Tax=Chelativorans sp. AA-79 TaxID=3028735 RepID=UPI0023F65E8F|nr:VOC family protein [Chelativorans sp. AA-79]WEX11439.1 VOC family protein [Chelativorans sp. AA-79]